MPTVLLNNIAKLSGEIGVATPDTLMNDVGFLIAIAIASMITLTVVIITIVAAAKILIKANVNPWVLLIPIYNEYIFFKIAGMKKWFWTSIIVSIIMSLLTVVFVLIGGTVAMYIAMACFAILLVYTLVVYVVYCAKLSASFDHGFFFMLGLLFFTYFFYLILAFDDSEYVGDCD